MGYTHELSHAKYFHAIDSTLNYVSSIGANNDKRRWSWDGGGLDRELSTSLTTNYKKRINSRWRGIFSTSVMGLCHAICYLFKKVKLFFCINWIPKRPKIMAQFGYLRLYFDIDIVSRRLLRWIARIENGLKQQQDTGLAYSNSVNPISTWLFR